MLVLVEGPDRQVFMSAADAWDYLSADSPDLELSDIQRVLDTGKELEFADGARLVKA